jgi:hypothetical protein
MMSEDLDWTQSLGEALSYQQKDVLIALQQLRDKAVADGIIKTDDKIKVSHIRDTGASVFKRRRPMDNPLLQQHCQAQSMR